MKEMKSYESMTVQEQWDVLATVANLYYNVELTQSQIADRMYTSRSKVSRMLKKARELGIVEIYIRELRERNLDFEQRLKKEFSLKNVRVIATKNSSEDGAFQKIVEAASYYFDSIVKPDMVVGISWGNTLYRLIRNIDTNNRKNIPITVVPIMGAANIKSPEKDAMELAKDLASAYGGKYHYIYAPLFVKNKTLKESLIEEQNIRNVLDLSENSEVILTSVGSIVYKSWSDYLSARTLGTLTEQGAVGHIGGHFYDINGKELATTLVERMIGITLDDIRKCPEVICVAYGESKADAVLGALRGGFLDTLIVDERCISKVLDLHKTKN